MAAREEGGVIFYIGDAAASRENPANDQYLFIAIVLTGQAKPSSFNKKNHSIATTTHYKQDPDRNHTLTG
jgi:hypothetical protein